MCKQFLAPRGFSAERDQVSVNISPWAKLALGNPEIPNMEFKFLTATFSAGEELHFFLSKSKN